MARRSREEWARLVTESRECGMAQVAFCRERGISVGALQYWIRKLREEVREQDAVVRILPVQATVPVAEDGLEVLLPNGVQLRFAPATEPAYVAAVVSALAA